MKKITLILGFLGMLIMGSFTAADSITVSLFQDSTENLFQNRYGESDCMSVLSFQGDKNVSGWGLFARGGYAHFYEFSDLSYYVQDIGIDRVWALRPTTALYFSLTGRGAFYRDEYRDFNYLSFAFYTALKSYLRPTSILKAEYTLLYRNYDFALFDHISHWMEASLDKYLQSKTTLKVQGAWGYKYFFHPFLDQPTASNDAGTSSWGQGGQGYGWGKGGNQNRAQSMIFFPSQQTSSGAMVFSLRGLAAQGFGNRIGLQISGSRQWMPSGESPYGAVEEYYYTENPTYDRFSWEGYEAGIMLTVLAPWNLQAKIGYNTSVKTFPGIESLDLEGLSLGIEREDRRREWNFRMEKNFSQFSLFLFFSRIDNRSNDPWFRWRGNTISLGIEWNFFFAEGHEN